MLFSSRAFSLVWGIVLLFAHVAIGDPVIVYDNSTSFTQGLDDESPAAEGFLAFNHYVKYDENPLPEPMGEEVFLEGTAREVVQFDLILKSNQPLPVVVVIQNLTLQIGEIIDYYDEEKESWYLLPEQILWTGTLEDVSINGITRVPFAVPNIIVPDGLTWIVSTDDMTFTAGLATCDPPTVGENDEGFWINDTSEDMWVFTWLNGDPVANFGVTIWATPEPTTLVLLLLGGFVINPRKNRRC